MHRNKAFFSLSTLLCALYNLNIEQKEWKTVNIMASVYTQVFRDFAITRIRRLEPKDGLFK